MSATVFASGQQEWNYFLGMALLGIAWNFSFSAGTVMLTESYYVCSSRIFELRLIYFMLSIVAA